MTSFAVVTDVIRGTPFAVVVTNNDKSDFYGVHQKGMEWAMEMSSKDDSSCCWSTPDGTVISSKGILSDLAAKTLFDAYGINQEVEETTNSIIVDRKPTGSSLYLGRMVFDIKSSLLPISGVSLGRFSFGRKSNAVAYKARAFKADSMLSSMTNEMSRNKIGFDESANMFRSRGFDVSDDYTPQRIKGITGNNSARRFGRAIGTEKKTTKKRLQRRTKNIGEISNLSKDKNTIRNRKRMAIIKKTRKF